MPVPEAAALVRLEVARDRAGPLHRLGDDPHRQHAGVRRDGVGQLRRRLDARPTCCRSRRVSGEAADRALKEHTSSVLARVTGARKGALVDGFLDDDTCSRLFGLVEHARELPTGVGSLRGMLTAAELDLGSEQRWVRSSTDQSNSVAFVNERYMLKMFRRVEPGINPEFEILAHLSRRGFARVPLLGGGLFYHHAGSEPSTLAVVQAAITHQGTGWEFTIDDLRRFYEAVAARTPQRRGAARAAVRRSDCRRSWRRPNGRYLASAQLLGRRTAEMHRALADPADDSVCSRAVRRRGTRSRVARDDRARRDTSSTCSRRSAAPSLKRCSRTAEAVLDARAAVLCTVSKPCAANGRPGCASASTATTTSARCCAPRRTSSSSTSKASRRAAWPSGATSSRR